MGQPLHELLPQDIVEIKRNVTTCRIGLPSVLPYSHFSLGLLCTSKNGPAHVDKKQDYLHHVQKKQKTSQFEFMGKKQEKELVLNKLIPFAQMFY